MNPIVLILLSSIIICWFLWLRSKPAAQQKKANLMLLVAVLGAALFYLAVTGKLHWLGVLLAMLIPFARRMFPLIPILGRLFQHYQSNKQTKGNSSEVSSRILTMTLDHDSGNLEGTVIEGPLKDRQLNSLSEQEFIQLLNYCRQQDPQSARLLETYLDKRFGDSWRSDDTDQTQTSVSETDKAYQILGLEPGANREEIIEAHRRLMQKLHPDRGGSDYLAAEINRAKDLLLKLL
ncbi:DnaJ domain-containing protein [Amphritea balenae]|uniref:Molecular chaperone DnaJ n=1 Tax=Amphritea balenae TaxID=452629 RepID=A0A3P1SX84_9GAMM|nr:DnaJ domain-containing protein [Amphritea balenae]RRD01146.1 molecular chaperone DnaJ [Amphritea balenae]